MFIDQLTCTALTYLSVYLFDHILFRTQLSEASPTVHREKELCSSGCEGSHHCSTPPKRVSIDVPYFLCRLYDTKVALRNVDLIDNRLEGTVQTLTSASSETEERLFVRWTDDGWTSIKNTEASKVAPNIYSFVIERTAGSTVKMAIKYIIGEHELWDTNHFHDFTF